MSSFPRGRSETVGSRVPACTDMAVVLIRGRSRGSSWRRPWPSSSRSPSRRHGRFRRRSSYRPPTSSGRRTSPACRRQRDRGQQRREDHHRRLDVVYPGHLVNLSVLRVADAGGAARHLAALRFLSPPLPPFLRCPGLRVSLIAVCCPPRVRTIHTAPTPLPRSRSWGSCGSREPSGVAAEKRFLQPQAVELIYPGDASGLRVLVTLRPRGYVVDRGTDAPSAVV